MQLMSWMLARLGSRFSLLFEPYRRRVMHSALGRFLDAPLDLMVGLVEPDGTERVLPLSSRGEPLLNCEQFPRINSITFRGYSERHQLRFEFNIHAPFYPENEALCVLPAFYLEMRVNPAGKVRWIEPAGDPPEKVKLFIRLAREQTTLTAHGDSAAGPARIELAYRNRLAPVREAVGSETPPQIDSGPQVEAFERIVSLNPGAAVDADGAGLSLELPVTQEGSGIKWRLVWGAHVSEPVLQVGADADKAVAGRLRYNRHFADINQVMAAAVGRRDDHLAHSRRFEKIFDQSPLQAHEHHLLNQSLHNYLSNSFWCDLADGREWYSVWEGSCHFHSTVDVEYNILPLYLCLWPRLLAMQLDQWPAVEKPHEPSGGGILSHDLGGGPRAGVPAYPHDMPVEENANYILMLQAYCYFTGDLEPARRHAAFVERLARYLLWTDRDDSGFPAEGTANTIDDAISATQFSRKQTYLAVKRVAALAAAADLLTRAGRGEAAQACAAAAAAAPPRIEQDAWLGDHFAVCVEPSGAGATDAWTGKPVAEEQLVGQAAYSIYTANGLLVPLMCGQAPAFNREKLSGDLVNAARECLGRYGCGHTSVEPNNVWVSQNLWRDHTARYLAARAPNLSSFYWDLQTMSNTGAQSFGFIDTYVNNRLCFYPRGIAALGWFIAQPRLVVDQLAAGGPRLSVEPDTHLPQRWPLLPLADWKAGKIPVCVVDPAGGVTIEGGIDPIQIRGQKATPPAPPRDPR